MRLRTSYRSVIEFTYRLTFSLSLLGVIAVVIELGFPLDEEITFILHWFYLFILFAGILTTGIRYFEKRKKWSWSVIIFDLVSVLYSLSLLFAYLFSSSDSGFYWLVSPAWLFLAVLITFVREFSEQDIQYNKKYLNPAQIFIFSFLGIIIIGTLLLLLPNATTQSISFQDALFTATSAVCVTGLIVVDTSTAFTLLGQSILLVLIQIGGIGILTFASYFSHFFKGGANFEQQRLLSEIFNSKYLGRVFSLIRRIIGITILIELIGAVLIFTIVDSENFNTTFDQLFFAIFHAISAFCNAGFSTLSDSLNTDGFKYAFGLQGLLAGLIIFGGLGFPIVVNILNYLKEIIGYQILRLTSNKSNYKPWLLNINSRIALVTSGILLLFGTVFFYISESGGVLTKYEGVEKLCVSFFAAVTPRTAGFNHIDFSALQYTTLLLVIILMWIGASPASTGGGIKTSTFAVAFLNVLNLSRGKTRIEVFKREIAAVSVNRAFAVMALSLVVIGSGVIVISITDPSLSLRDIVFECFSAYSTVGLSLGITSELSIGGKSIIIATMFIGRVGMLSILIGLSKHVYSHSYRYPTEEIIIN